MRKRKTQSKMNVLELLKRNNTAMSHDMIAAELHEINRATIYRILNSFCDDGILHKVVDENGKQFFALCSNCEATNHRHNHLHFKCNVCNTIECLQSELEYSLPVNYYPENFNAVITGQCDKCA